ncbi:MAG TPA: hypothetical protein VHI52_21575, partial [Verrucomicrobiae bacterium]|nr:hypothetical protein [Verrucomicrobiae bacterium]
MRALAPRPAPPIHFPPAALCGLQLRFLEARPMDATLRRFIRDNYAENPAAAIPLRELAEAFRATLPEADRSWPRQRLIGELSKGGYTLGEI